jgi:hypothetical protein
VAHRGGWASGAAGRDRPDGVPTAKGGRTAAGEASHYPAVLRAGGRGEVEPQWGKGRGECTAVALTSERGRRRWCVRILDGGGAPRVGVVGKATGRSFAHGVLRSEDGGGRTEPRRDGVGGALLWRLDGTAEGKGGGSRVEGGWAASGGHAARESAGRGGPVPAADAWAQRRRPTRTVTFLIYSKEFQKEAT